MNNRVVTSALITLVFLVGVVGSPVLAKEPTGNFSADPTWVRLGGPPGGLGYDIRYNFDTPNIWYVTDAFAGAFISFDRGLTWQSSSTGIPSQGGQTGDAIPVFSLTVDPNNPLIVWAGTDGTGHIYKSIDSGHTWNEMDSGIEFSGYSSLTFRGFTVDPFTSDVVYAMGELKKEVFSQGGSVWGLGNGGRIYRTVDGGRSWEIIWDGGVPSALTRYMWINPREPASRNDDILYVSTGIFDRGAVGEGNPNTDIDPFGGLGVLRSRDGGQTWETLDEDNGFELLYIGSLYMHPEDPDILLAAAGHILQGPSLETIGLSGSAPGGVYRTTDGGDHWVHVLASSGNQTFEVMSSVEICPPPYSNIAYAGSNAAIYRSEDSGETWTLVVGAEAAWGPPGVEAGWPIDMQCDPSDPDRIFANNYNGGNFLSEDGGRTWVNASQGYSGAQVLSLAVDSTAPGRVYAAGRSGLWRADDGGTVWNGLRYPSPEITPFMEYTAIGLDSARPGRVLSGNLASGFIQESLDYGMTWRHLWPPLNSNNEPTIMPLPAVTEILFSPSDPKRVYASFANPTCPRLHEPCGEANGVAVSRDGGETWQLSTDARIQNQSVLDLSVDPANAEVVFAAAESGLFHSVNGGATWETVSITNDSMGARFRAVAIDPANSQRILAAVDGMFASSGTTPGIYLSVDGGKTWRPSYEGFELESSIHAILFDPADSRVVYASDYASGMYRSLDGGEHWLQINNGLLNRNVTGLAISSDGLHLYAATNGAGVFRLDLNGQPPLASTQTGNQPPIPTAAAEDLSTPKPMATPEGVKPATSDMTWLYIGAPVGLIVLILLLVWMRRKRKS